MVVTADDQRRHWLRGAGTLCNQITDRGDLVDHPVFANRKICNRLECQDRVRKGFHHDMKGGYSECMVCFAQGRVVECCNAIDTDRKCPWVVCVGCLFYQEDGQRSIWKDQVPAIQCLS